MNTNRSPSIGPDPGVNRSGRALLSVVCVVHAQFPSTRSAAMHAIVDATPRTGAPRGASVDVAVSRFSMIVLMRERQTVADASRRLTRPVRHLPSADVHRNRRRPGGTIRTHDAAPLPNPNGALFVLDRPDQKSGDRALAVWKELDHVAAVGKARVGNRRQPSRSLVIVIQVKRVARKRDDDGCDLVWLPDLV